MSEQTKPYDVPTPTEDKKADIAYYMRLREFFAREQVALIVQMIEQARDLALSRKVGQTVTLYLNEKGYLREVSGSNNVKVQVPKQYQAE